MVIIQHPQEPNPNEPTCRGEMIQVGGRSDRSTGYLARSERSGPAILILHEWFGLQDSFKALADRFCSEGFTALAIDMYDGYLATSVEEAEAFEGKLDHDALVPRLVAAARSLADNWHPRVGLMGFSLGAFMATKVAHEFPFEATSLVYGYTNIYPDRFSGALQGHFAETDEFEPLEDARAYFEKLSNEGMDVEFHHYPGTGHWFANPGVPDAFDPQATEQVFSRTVDFMHHHLA